MDADAALMATPEGFIGNLVGIFMVLAFGAALALIVCKLAKRSAKTTYVSAAILSALLAVFSVLGSHEAYAVPVWVFLAAILYWGYRRALRPKTL